MVGELGGGFDRSRDSHQLAQPMNQGLGFSFQCLGRDFIDELGRSLEHEVLQVVDCVEVGGFEVLSQQQLQVFTNFLSRLRPRLQSSDTFFDDHDHQISLELVVGLGLDAVGFVSHFLFAHVIQVVDAAIFVEHEVIQVSDVVGVDLTTIFILQDITSSLVIVADQPVASFDLVDPIMVVITGTVVSVEVTTLAPQPAEVEAEEPLGNIIFRVRRFEWIGGPGTANFFVDQHTMTIRAGEVNVFVAVVVDEAIELLAAEKETTE